MISLVERATTISVFGEPNELTALVDEFKFKHPDRYRIQSYQLYSRTKHSDRGPTGWDGYIKPLKRVGLNQAEIRRGFKDDLLANIKKFRMELNEDSKLLVSPFNKLTTADIPDNIIDAPFALDENQRLCIVNWLKHGMGLGKISVNGGKTACFAGFAAMLKTFKEDARMLYVTDRERLTAQVDREMQNFLPGWDITKYGGGKSDKTGKDMVVCTLAMIRKHLEELIEEGWINSFNAVLFDESHHAASESAEKLMMEIKGAFFRIGASDTAKEKNIIAWHTIKGLLGPVRVTVDSAELIEMGRSAVPHIYMIDPPGWEGKFEHVPYNASRDSTAWVLFEGSQNMVKGTYQGPVLARDPETGQILTEKKRELKGVKFVKTEVAKTVPGLHQVLVDGVEYEVNSSYCLLRRSVDECIIRFKERNELIAEWVQHFSNQNKRTLVVATRTIHVLILESVISEAVDPDLVRILVGEDSAKKRDETFEWFKSTPGAVLISPLVKEGVSINEIEAGVVADYIGDFEYAKQIIGRFMRKKKDGENVCEIAWFWDRQQTRFERGCKNLFKELRQQKGFVYYHPVVHPADAQRLKQDDLFVDTTAEIESAEGVNVDTSARTA